MSDRVSTIRKVKWKRGMGLCMCEWAVVIFNTVVREDLSG